MSKKTPYFKWDVPELGEEANVPADMLSLATEIEEDLHNLKVSELGTAGAGDNNKILVVGATGAPAWVAMSGAATIANTGVVSLVNSAVTAAKIAALAVEEAKIAGEAVSEAKLKALAVTAAKLAAEAVTEGKLAALAVTEAKLAGEAVSTAKLKALAVTEEKIAALAVSSGKLAAGAVTEEKIANGACKPIKVASQTNVSVPETGHLPTSPVVRLAIGTAASIKSLAAGAGGQMVTFICGPTAGTPTFKDSTGNLKMAGDFLMGEDDTITFCYNSQDERWHEVCRSNN